MFEIEIVQKISKSGYKYLVLRVYYDLNGKKSFNDYFISIYKNDVLYQYLEEHAKGENN